MSTGYHISHCPDMPIIYGPSADTDPGQAYPFQCDDDGLFAVSLDPESGNLPRGHCAKASRSGWTYYAWREDAYHPHGF
jgi:hypothetical protein